jgi:nicotinamide-nucleotide amidase
MKIETLESEVGKLLAERRMTLAVAESCSGGLLSKRLTDVAGSSDYFLAGVISYSNAAKQRFLGVPLDMLDQHGAVSAEVAAAMAEGVRTAAVSDLGLAVTGIAGPAGGTLEKPVGTVFVALADSKGVQTRQLSFTGNRSEIRDLTVCDALKWLGRHLSGIAPAAGRGRS